MHILYFLNRKKENKRGYAPIYCRLTIRGQRSEFSTGLFTTAKDWNQNTQSITADDPNTEISNLQLSHMTADLRMIKMNLEQSGPVTPDMIKSTYKKKAEPVAAQITLTELLSRFILEKIKHIDAGFDKESVRHYKARLQHVHNFVFSQGEINFLADDVTEAFGHDLIHWLKVKGKHPNTIYKVIQVLSQALKFGVNKRLIQCNEIAQIKLSYKIPDNIDTITENELQAIESYKDLTPELIHIRDVYVLQDWTGVEYADLVKLNDPSIYKHRTGTTIIEYRRQKSKIIGVLPLYPTARKILEKYNYNVPIPPNAYYNYALKIIAAKVGIRIKLVSNTARKSFGQHRLNEGWSMEHVSRMLGHASIKTTQNWYARIGIDAISNAFNRMQGPPENINILDEVHKN